MRTTINIDDPILKGLKRLQNREGKPLGRLVSDLLAQALATRQRSIPPPPRFRWIAKPMRARLDLADKHALLDALDESDPQHRRRLRATENRIELFADASL